MKLHRSILFPWTLVAFAGITGCPEGGGGKSGSCDLDKVRYEGYATDETCITLVDAEDAGSITDGGANAPVLISPTNGGAIAASASALTITFDTPLDLDLVRAPRPAASRVSLAALLRHFPIAEAQAHEPPVTGAIHRLRFTGIGGSDEPVDVYTSKMDYTLDAELLADVLATDGSITLEMTSMYVTQNLINNASTDGPFRMTPSATLTVE